MKAQSSQPVLKKSVLLCLAFVLGTILLTGAKEVTLELRHRPAQRELAISRIKQWSQTLLQEVPRNQDCEFRNELTPDQVLFLIKSCTLSPAGHSEKMATNDVEVAAK